MTVNLAFRGYVNGGLIFEESVSLDYPDGNPPTAIFDELTDRHGAMILNSLKPGDRHMIEIEFLDEPDENKRFFRIGDDRSMMQDPIQVDPLNLDLSKWKG